MPMQNLEISVSFASIMGAIGSIVGGYIIWSAKRLIANLDNTVEELKNEMKDRCAKHEERLADHDRCLTRIVTHHQLNHNQHIECDL